MSSNWLAQLAPGHPPEPAGWWPPAPGWWGLLVLSVLLATAIAWWRLRDPHRSRRRAALREIRLIRAHPTGEAAAAIEDLLRRFAVTVFGVASVGKLSGEAWLRFIGSQGGEPLAGEHGRSLLAAAFGNAPVSESERWLAGAEMFVRRAARRRRAP
ncbi:MAG: DUF4381 domain-containing protein [Steroidobacteraceae bacterium]